MRHSFLAAAIACLLAFGTLPAGHAACSRPFNMAMENWPPYVYTDARGKPAGLDIELVQAIFAEAGCTLRIEAEVPRKRRMLMHQEGELALLLAASDTPERRQHSWFTLPYRHESTGLAALQQNAAQLAGIHSFADLQARKITLLSPSSGWYGQDYADHLATIKAAHLLSHFEELPQGMKMLQAGRGLLILGDVGSLDWEARRLGIKLQFLPYLPVNDSVHLMLSRKNATKGDIRQLNAAIGRLEKNGKLAAIRARYGMQTASIPLKVSTPNPSP